MKKTLFFGIICLFCTISVFSQSKRTMKLLQEGIKSNDFVKINEAISKGAVFSDDDLSQAIHENKIDLAKFIVGKGVPLSKGLLLAVKENNQELINIFIDQGANVNHKDTIYFMDIDVYSNEINKYYKVITNDNGIRELPNVGKTISYTPHLYKGVLDPMYFALLDGNLTIIKLLYKKGYEFNTAYLVGDMKSNFNWSNSMLAGMYSDKELFSDVKKDQANITLLIGNFGIVAKGNVIKTQIYPTPAQFMTPLQIASNKSNKEILGYLVDSLGLVNNNMKIVKIKAN